MPRALRVLMRQKGLVPRDRASVLWVCVVSFDEARCAAGAQEEGLVRLLLCCVSCNRSGVCLLFALKWAFWPLAVKP